MLYARNDTNRLILAKSTDLGGTVTITFSTLADLANLAVAAYGQNGVPVATTIANIPGDWEYLDLRFLNTSFIFSDSDGDRFVDIRGFYNFISNGSTSEYTSDTQLFAAFNHTTKQVVISFRGTEFPGPDVATDAGIAAGSLYFTRLSPTHTLELA